MFSILKARLGVQRAAAGGADPHARRKDAAPRCCVRCWESFCSRGMAAHGFCPHCGCSMRLSDLTLSGWRWAGAVETAGMLSVEAGGRVTAPGGIRAGMGAVLQGRIDGALTSGGVVSIGPRAIVCGDVRAPRIQVSAGATIAGRMTITHAFEDAVRDASDRVLRPEPWRSDVPAPNRHPFARRSSFRAA